MRHIFVFWRYAPNQKKYAQRGGRDAPFWRKCAKSGDTAQDSSLVLETRQTRESEVGMGSG